MKISKSWTSFVWPKLSVAIRMVLFLRCAEIRAGVWRSSKTAQKLRIAMLNSLILVQNTNCCLSHILATLSSFELILCAHRALHFDSPHSPHGN